MESLIKKEIPDAKSFFLESSDGTPISYLAGQFLTLVFPKGETEDRRSYSFSTAPQSDPTAAITVKKVDNGEYSRKLLDYARVGDEFLTIGTSGFFTFPENVNQFEQLIFLAAGSGITPVISLIKSSLARKTKASITLIYSNHSKQTTLFYKELVELQAAHAEVFRIEFLFGDSPNLGRARLGKLLLEKLLKEYVATAYSKCLFFLCGPHDYMRMATIVLQTEGTPAQNIKKENFAAVKPRFVVEPPDKDSHHVTLYANGNEYSFDTQYPDSILQSAKKAGISLPYSCESGQCGTCVATCVTGKTWMKNNEVLVDAEVNKGRTLTCTAFPIGGDVTLKI
jgi:ring-1,2-phenylacetyl-CoA epoxidase subunit PaaE